MVSESALVDGSIEGKRVVASDGDEIGTVSSVRGGTMYVELDSQLGEGIGAKLGRDRVDRHDYPLPTDVVDRLTEDTVYLGEL